MAPSTERRLPVWIFPLLAIILAGAWQWATVHANYGGNWTALFCTGSIQPRPPLVFSEHIYLFPNSAGYDGEMYHYVAHDPFLRTNLKSYVDAPRLRYRRILVPLLAYTLALGRQQWVDAAYEFVFLLTVGLGVYWSCRFAERAGLAAAWGLLFLLMPAIPISMDRLVVDGTLAALTAAFVYYCEAPSWKLFLVLAAAALTRETGLLLIAAYCIHLAWHRAFRTAAVFLSSALPTLAWYAYVLSQTKRQSYGLSFVPLSGIIHVLIHPAMYRAGTPFLFVVHAIVHAADYLALAGVLVAFGMAIVWFRRAFSEPVRIAALLFALLVLVVQKIDIWQDVYNFSRVCTPLLLCLAALAARYRKPWLLAPTLMILPRLGIQLASQFLGIVRWVA